MEADTIVVGGGPAGLAAAYHLRGYGSLLVLEAERRVGDHWRSRWDSLRLFTPAKYSGLPGMAFPAAAFHFPTKDEVGDYLEAYAERFALPLVPGARADRLCSARGRYELAAGARVFSAARVIVATGAYQRPAVPAWSAALDRGITQLHSSEYRAPAQIPPGSVLVVGAGNSGSEIAMELAASGRRVTLAGRSVGRLRVAALGGAFGGLPYWWLVTRLLSVRTPIGRRVRDATAGRGSPLIRIDASEIRAAGITRGGRAVRASGGLPVLEDGSVVEARSVVWATGFRRDYGWIRLPGFAAGPAHRRGVVDGWPGLYFVGLPFQSSLASSLIGGVGEDARFVAGRIRRRGLEP